MEFQTYSDGYIKSNIKLSIGMLVSNHIQYIEKCLEGVKPLLDSIPAELIILDTVGPEKSDGSIEVCRKYTDKIYRFEWINDFAAARNALLEHSSGEWFMFQDDDEWFDDVSEFVEFFSGDEYHKYNSGFYNIKDYDSEGGFVLGIGGRFIRRKPDSHFVGKIHETYNEACAPGKQFSTIANHMGYAYKNEEEKSKKSERNVSLLEEEIKNKGLNPIRCAQLVQEYMAMTAQEKKDIGYKYALDYTDELIHLGYGSNNCTQWIICAQARYFLVKADGEGAVERIRNIRDKYRLSRFAQLVLAEVEVDAITHYLNAGEFLNQISDDVRQYMKIDEFFSNHPEEQLAEAQLDFPRYYTQAKKNAMYMAGAQTDNYLGKFDSALDYWKNVKWEDVTDPHRYKENILTTLQGLTDSGPLENYYRYFMNSDIFEEGHEKYLPKELRVNKKSRPILSISLLVSNRIDTIQKTMEALKRLRDNVPSEIIVVDTVGEEKSDGSLVIAEKYADKVIRFDWINDFSAARNAGMAECSGEWFMFLDDDEWFDDVSDITSFFNSGEYKNYTHATYDIRNYLDYSGSNYQVSRLVRLAKMDSCVRFEGRIHENLVYTQGKCRHLKAFEHHYGYADTSPEKRKKHQMRNLPILLDEYEKNPADTRLAVQLAKEMFYCEDTFKMGYEFSEERARAYTAAGLEWHPYVQWLVLAKFTFWEFWNYDSKLEYVNSLCESYAFSAGALMAIHYSLMKLAEEENRSEEIQYHLTEWEKCCESVLNDSDECTYARSLDWANALEEYENR